MNQNQQRIHIPATIEEVAAKPVTASRSGWIYFVQCVTGGPIKIGQSRTPDARLDTFQQGCPFELQILGMIEGTKEDERRLHERFAADRLHGEWFRDTPALLEYVQPMKDRAADRMVEDILRIMEQDQEVSDIIMNDFMQRATSDPSLMAKILAA